MNLRITEGKSNTEMHVGFAGAEILPPGRYHLGRFSFRVIEGNPSLSIVATSEIDPRFHTSFGSMLEGVDGDNTLKLSGPSAAPGLTSGDAAAGDWTDTGGLTPDTKGTLAAALEGTPPTRFSASMAGSGRDRLKLRVTTTRPGFLRVAIFDVQGRLVADLMKEQFVASGVREINVNVGPGSKRLSAGIYFYRVAASEGVTSGRFAVIK